MNERVHRYLDGELPLSELTETEAAEARRMETFAAELRRERAETETADLVAGVMRTIATGADAADGFEAAGFEAAGRASADDRTTGPGAGPRRLAGWLLGKRQVSFTLRPVYAVAAVLLLLFAGSQLELASPTTSPDAPVTAAGDDPTVFVRFEISAPDARSVRLAGSFSDWSPEIELDPIGNGRWMALVPLRPGVHDYAFRVDGSRWVTDPSAPRVADGFGGFNSRLSLVVANS
ncbi:MAG: glycogen-binding domain-containing protein [Gemmatimonadota bacterium]